VVGSGHQRPALDLPVPNVQWGLLVVGRGDAQNARSVVTE